MRAVPFALLAACVAAAPVSADEKDGFVPLFDGKSLAGWTGTVKPDKDGKVTDWKRTWSVRDGLLHCTGKPNGYVATEKEYADYLLRVKWRYPAGVEKGNSGVLLHVQKEDKVWPVCIEAQLRAGRAGDIWLNFPPQTRLDIDRARFDAGNKERRHYWRIGKDDPIERPADEWNQYEITCRGGDVTLVINGKTVNEGKDGNLRRGRIALQSEGTNIEFRDIEIKLLK